MQKITEKAQNHHPNIAKNCAENKNKITNFFAIMKVLFNANYLSVELCCGYFTVIYYKKKSPQN